MGERRGTKALELWCRRMVDGYPGVKIDNMTTSWRDGLAFCAIIHHFRPDLIDFSKLTKGDIYYNNDLAFTVAEKHLGIPALLEPEDMVEYEVPDRLSILTYLAQFYRAFVTPQGSSQSRIVPKRPATTADRGIVSPASTSPPTKMVNRSGGVPRRDPCEKCGLPVFIAERLNVGKLLYHRTCFRCARCNSQLTLANYYETDSNQFCCETCPDEEPTKVQPTSFLDKPSVLSRSLSDEEKSASLKKKDSDDYSAVFESALENTDDPTLKKDSTLTREFSSARSAFLTAQVVVSSSESDEEMPPELPKTKPPDISGNDNISDSVNSSNKPETTVVYRTKVSDQLNAASAASLSPVKSVTKDNPNALDGRPTSVRDRMKQFEKAQSPTTSNRSSPIRTQSDGKTSPIRASPTGSFEKAQSPTQTTRSSHIRTQPDDNISSTRASLTGSSEKIQSPTQATRSSHIRTQSDDKISPIRASPTGSVEKAQSPTQTTRSSHIRTQPDDKISSIRASLTGSSEKIQSPTQATRSSHIRTQSDDRTSPSGASLRASSEKLQSPTVSTRSSHIRTLSDDKTSPIKASPRGSLQRKSSPAREKLESRFSPITEKSGNSFSPIRTKTENLPTQFTKSKSSSPIKEKIVAPPTETVVESKPLPVRRKSENPTTPKLGTVQTSSPTKSPTPRPETLSIAGKLENRSTPHKAYPDSIKSPTREKSSPIKTREDFRRSTPDISPRRSSIELPKVSELKRKFASPTVMEQSPKVPPLEAKPAEATPATPTNLNFLLEKQIGLKKSKTTPAVNPEKEHIPPRRPFSDISSRSPSDPQIQLPRRFEENVQDLAKSDVSALDSNVVDVGVVAEASKVAGDKCTDNVSEKLVAEDHRQVLGDGNLEDVPSDVDNKLVPERSDSDNNVDISSVSKEPVELLHSSSKEDISVEIVNTPEVINISDSTEEIIDTSQTINDSAITIKDSIIVISDDSKVDHLDEVRNEEEYPEDLNPFGDEDEDKDMNLTKSSNPFDDDEDEEEIVTKPIPAVRRKVKSSEEKNACLNPFGDEDDEEETKTQQKPKPTNRSKIVAKLLQSDEDTPENLKNERTTRISVSPFVADKKQIPLKDRQKLLGAPRISFNPFWSDADEDEQEDEDEGGLPRPKPRESRTTDTPEKQKNQQGLSTFGSSSSLSSVNSGVQSVRKKKPAPRPPILSPDRQESTQSSLTSSPNASVQHSPRLSTPKNRKTRRAPLPPSSTPNKTLQSVSSFGLIPIQHDGVNTGIEDQDWDKQKEAKDEVNRNRQSQIFTHSDSDVPQSPNYIPDKSTFGKWKRKKGPAPSRPVPQRRSIKQLPMTEIKKELDLIELQQQGLEKQGVRLEQIIRERCEGPNVNPEEIEPIDVDDLILQLFEVVNEKNELCRRQAELMYIRRQQRLEEEHAEVEYEIRCLMMQPEANKTDTDKAREEELINRLVNIVERRNEIIECLEMDRVRENDEDNSITNSLNTYAAKRDEVPVTPEPEILDKKDKKKKKKIKIKFMKKSDLDKDIDESETSSVSSGKEKKKKKFTLF